MRISYLVALFILSIYSLSSCLPLSGIKESGEISAKKSARFRQRHDISTVYSVNPAAFMQRYSSLRSGNDSMVQVFDNLFQPLQLIVFDAHANNICHLVNCNIGGIPLKWNRYQSFDSVPVLPKDFRQPAYTVSLEEACDVLS